MATERRPSGSRAAAVHQDHKKVGRIPPGGGWRVRGRENIKHPEHRTTGYDHIEVVIDDNSRFGVVVDVPDESAGSAARALEIAAAEFASHGIAIERVLTDNGWAYTHGRAYARLSPASEPATRGRGLSTSNQRQGRTFHPDAAQRVGLRTAIPIEPGTTRRAAGLRRLLQSRPTPYRSRRSLTLDVASGDLAAA